MPQEDEETNPTIVVSSDEDGQKDPGGRAHKRREPPQSPPGRRERKFTIFIHPKVTSLKTMTGKQKVSPDWSLQMKTKTP